VSDYVFVDVDTQADFLEPWGALYIAGSAGIRLNLARLSGFALERGIAVLATACSHLEGDEELERFPAHCLAGTPGQARIAETARGDSVVVGPDERWEGLPPVHLTLEKREIDVFSRSDVAELLGRYPAGAVFVVYGVATDYCVREMVLGLLERGRSVQVVVDAVRAIDPAREPELLTEFVRRGAVLTVTAEVCRD